MHKLQTTIKNRLTEEFGLDIARGSFLENEIIHFNKFGWSDTVSTTFQTVWDGNSVYAYLDTASTVSVASTAAEDAGGVVEIQGLDEDWNLQVKLVNIGETSIDTWLRVFRVRVTVCGPGQSTNVGDISVSANSTTLATIKAGAGQTLMCTLTVPKNYTGYLMNWQASIAKDKDVVYRIMQKCNIEGGQWNIKGQFGSFGVPVGYHYDIPLVIPEKADLEIQVKAGATTETGAVFDMIFIRNY